MKPCVHCQGVDDQRASGLCWRCYDDAEIRILYTLAYVGVGVDIGMGEPDLPDRPTTAYPGTVDKIKVMRRRANQGRAIFHPEDIRHHEGHQALLEAILLDYVEELDGEEEAESDLYPRYRARASC